MSVTDTIKTLSISTVGGAGKAAFVSLQTTRQQHERL
jgi:hypothetical protein